MPTKIVEIITQAVAQLALWIAGLVIVLFILGWLLRLVGQDQYHRKISVFMVPIFAALERLISVFKFVFIAGFLFVTITKGRGNAVQLVPLGSPERKYGDMAFGTFFFLFCGVMLPWTFGVPLQRMAERAGGVQAAALAKIRFHVGVIAGLIIFYYPGRYGWVAVVCSLVYAALIMRLSLAALAHANASQAPVVRESESVPGDELTFLHISDLHVTDHESRAPVGGGAAGNIELERLAQNITTGARKCRYLVITGDVADRGTQAEWNKALVPLLQMRDSGTHIIVAPGNHDLVPTYEPLDAFWATVGKRRFLTPFVDGVRLFRYLDLVGQLEPGLMDCDGKCVRYVVDDYKRRMAALKEAWDAMDDRARAAIQFPANKPRYSLANRLRYMRPDIGASIGGEFAKIAHELFPKVLLSEWQRLYLDSAFQHMELALTYPLWAERWHELFPLRLPIDINGVEFLILNSIDFETRLAGSAFGKCGVPQLERTKKLLQESQANTVLVLNHHSPFRWENDQRVDLNRWALLAHDASESQEFAEILKETAKEKTVIFLSGHVHGASRCGTLVARHRDDKVLPNVWFLEAGALGEKGAVTLPCGWITPGGMSVGRVNRAIIN